MRKNSGDNFLPIHIRGIYINRFGEDCKKGLRNLGESPVGYRMVFPRWVYVCMRVC